jgi:hypothetical protein
MIGPKPVEGVGDHKDRLLICSKSIPPAPPLLSRSPGSPANIPVIPIKDETIREKERVYKFDEEPEEKEEEESEQSDYGSG